MHTIVAGPSRRRLVNLGVHRSVYFLVDYWISEVIVVIDSLHAVNSTAVIGINKIGPLFYFFSFVNYVMRSYLLRILK